MKIVEVKCKACQAVYETLESVPQKDLKCPGCGSDELEFKKTEKDFSPCGGGCSNCNGNCE